MSSNYRGRNCSHNSARLDCVQLGGSVVKKSTRKASAQKNGKASTQKNAPARSNEKRPPQMAAITNQLLTDIRSLQFAKDEVLKVLAGNAKKKAEQFAAKHGLDEGDKKITLQIPVEDASEFARQIEDLLIAVKSMPLTLNGLFLVLVSKWDAYIGLVLRWLYTVQPSIINSSGRSILYTELREMGDLAAAREKIVDEEIGSVLRESHSFHFEYLEKKIGIPLTKGLDLWPQFVELTQRRHLVAHTDGRVSHQYLKVCLAAGALSADDAPALGSELKIKPDYFLASCRCLTELGFKLSQVLWRKLQPNEVARADGHLIRTTFEMIVAGQYDSAIKLLEFALQPPMKFNEVRDRMVCIINLAQAFKWSGNNRRCLAILAQEDWTGANIDFRIIVAVLRDEFNEAAELMKKMGPSGDLRKEDFADWPAFQEFRKAPQFLKVYREVFKTEVEVRDVPSDVNSILSDVSTKARAQKASRRSRVSVIAKGERDQKNPSH